MNIQLVRNKDVDKVKWDQCVLTADPSLVYANSWYLDVVCPGWQALVIDDYAAVFPLPIKKKLGLSYCHQPLFAQQLGLFSAEPGKFDLALILKSIPRSVLSIRLFLNHRCKAIAKSDFSNRLNHVLPIADTEGLKAGFNQNTRRNIKRSLSNSLELRTTIDIDTFVSFKKATSSAVLNDEAWIVMKKLIHTLIDHNCGQFMGAYKDNVLVSALFLSNYNDRVTYLFSASSAEGKEERASFFLVNEILNAHADSGKILDFEGSMDENISRFFKGFGAVEEVYYEFKKGIGL